MDIRRIAVFVPSKKNHFLKFVPSYEVPVLREVMKKQANSVEYKKFGIVTDIPREECGVVQEANIEVELKRMRETYRGAFRAAYPTDNDFETAFEQSAAEYGVKTGKDDTGGKLSKREVLPIEQIKGIGPKFADGVAELLGDGELETLANAKPYMLAGIAGVTVKQVEEFVAEAKELAGISDELTIQDPEK